MTRRVFTPDQDIEVGRMYEDGISAQKIANHYGVDKSSVLGALKRVGMDRRTNRVLSDAEEEVVAEAYASGIGTAELGERYGVVQGTILRIVERRGGELRGNFWYAGDNEPLIVEMYRQCRSVKEVADRFGVGIGAINTVLDRNGVQKQARLLSDEDDKVVAELYLSGLSVDAVTEKMGLSSRSVVDDSLNRLGIERRPHRKYFFDEHIFDIIDNEDKAYWLGFMYSDGNVSRGDLTRFGLAVKDVNQLRKFREFMGAEVPIETRQDQSAVHISFYSKILAGRLRDIGIVVGRGQFEKTLPALNRPVMYRHFLRGFVDGDGTFDKRRVRALGQPDILGWTREIFGLVAGVTRVVPITPRRGIHECGWYAREQVNKILEFLYLDCNTFLDRKYERAMSILASR